MNALAYDVAHGRRSKPDDTLGIRAATTRHRLPATVTTRRHLYSPSFQPLPKFAPGSPEAHMLRVSVKGTPMASPAQFAANQANAQSSTGPRTPEGKAQVSQNALKHGRTSSQLVIGPGQQEEFDALQSALLADLDPQGAVEIVVFHDLVHAAWNLHRYRALEVQYSSPEEFAVLDRISRYHSRTQRAYYKALSELRILQTNRALRARKLPAEEAAQVPTITDINNLTKQTHSEVKAEALKQALNMVDLETRVMMTQVLKSKDITSRTAPAGQFQNPAA